MLLPVVLINVILDYLAQLDRVSALPTREELFIAFLQSNTELFLHHDNHLQTELATPSILKSFSLHYSKPRKFNLSFKLLQKSARCTR